MENPTPTDNDQDALLFGNSRNTFPTWVKENKKLVSIAGSLLCGALIAVIITFVVVDSQPDAVVIPTTLAPTTLPTTTTPTTTPTTSTTTPATTTTTTTTQPTTTTTTTQPTTTTTTTQPTTTTTTTQPTTTTTTTQPTTTTTTTQPTTTTTTTQPTTTTTTTEPTTTTTQPTTTTTTTQPTTTKSTTASTTTADPTTGPPPPFHPPTLRPLPKNATSLAPVTLLYQMLEGETKPVFTEIPCPFQHEVPTFKSKVVVLNHTYVWDGADAKQLAKKGTAMVANEALFDLKYPENAWPHPTYTCGDTDDDEE